MAGAPRPNIGPSSPPRLRAPNGGASPRFWRPCRRSVSTRISSGSSRAKRRVMYLIDTDVISEARKGDRANSGVIGFFKEIVEAGSLAFVASVTIGELRRGVELIRRRGDVHQRKVSRGGWKTSSMGSPSASCPSTPTRRRSGEGSLDKQIAAIALVNDLTLATRNVADFQGLVRV